MSQIDVAYLRKKMKEDLEGEGLSKTKIKELMEKRIKQNKRIKENEL